MVLRGEKFKPEFNFPRSCTITRWKAELWQTRAATARKEYRKWLADEYTLKDYVHTDGSGAWFKAIDQAQKPYPGTEAWLKSCSASEGGWGRWVPNSDGAPPGGWMQMYYSTWYSMFYGWYGNEGALAYLERRGYYVPRSAHSWYSTLGQALSSAHGYKFGRRGEWHGPGCYQN